MFRAAAAVAACGPDFDGGTCMCGSGRHGRRPDVSAADFLLLVSGAYAAHIGAVKNNARKELGLTKKQYKSLEAVGRALMEDAPDPSLPSMVDAIEMGFVHGFIDGCHSGDMNFESLMETYPLCQLAWKSVKDGAAPNTLVKETTEDFGKFVDHIVGARLEKLAKNKGTS